MFIHPGLVNKQSWLLEVKWSPEERPAQGSEVCTEVTGSAWRAPCRSDRSRPRHDKENNTPALSLRLTDATDLNEGSTAHCRDCSYQGASGEHQFDIATSAARLPPAVVGEDGCPPAFGPASFTGLPPRPVLPLAAMFEQQRQRAFEEIPAAEPTRPVLNLGRTVATPGALTALVDAHESGLWYLRRHQCGDWGELSAEDWAANYLALREGSRILSAYRLPTGTDLWIITEWNRSVTTLLLPEEY